MNQLAKLGQEEASRERPKSALLINFKSVYWRNLTFRTVSFHVKILHHSAKSFG